MPKNNILLILIVLMILNLGNRAKHCEHEKYIFEGFVRRIFVKNAIKFSFLSCFIKAKLYEDTKRENYI